MNEVTWLAFSGASTLQCSLSQSTLPTNLANAVLRHCYRSCAHRDSHAS